MDKNSVFCGMNLVHKLLYLILHTKDFLEDTVKNYHNMTYGILAAIIFSETGFIVTPFLPGDSLLFAAGALSADAATGLNVFWLMIICFIAAFIGNMVNYQAGRMLGLSVFEKKIPFLKKEQLERTHAFFEKYGGRTILYSRFMPVIRTIAPFVAGVGRMGYGEFILYNALGGALWVAICVGAGFKLGTLPFVQKHFEAIVVAIICVSIVPMIVAALTSKKKQSTPTI